MVSCAGQNLKWGRIRTRFYSLRFTYVDRFLNYRNSQFRPISFRAAPFIRLIEAPTRKYITPDADIFDQRGVSTPSSDSRAAHPIGSDVERNTLQAMVYSVDSDLNIKYASESVAEKFNCKSCDLVGKSVFAILDRMHSNNGKRDLMNTLYTGDPLQSATEVIFPSGPRMLSTVLFPIKGADGKVVETLVVSYDITEHHEIDQLIRNRMGVILGYAEVLSGLIDDADARKMVEKIRDASANLQETLNQDRHAISGAPQKQP